MHQDSEDDIDVKLLFAKFYKGVIDEVVIFDGALSGFEIKILATWPKSGW